MMIHRPHSFLQPVRDETSEGEEFFGNKTYLTVSGQLHAEAACR